MKKYKLVFECEDFLIIDKEIGIPFEGEEGILNTLRKDFFEVYGVHRLDKATSGLMIFARKKTVQSRLSLLFQDKKIKKTYLALSPKRPKKKMGHIKGDLEKGRGGSYYLKQTNLRPSHTKFKSFYDEKNKLRVFLLEPQTGQTHQLRVHLKSLGSPILGDRRYGGEEADRMYLAAIKLEFSYAGKEIKIESYPASGEYFKRVKDVISF